MNESNPEEEAVARVTTMLSVNSLRRASPIHSPTRTLRITEAEHSSRDTTPVSLAADALVRRPRSNPRSRIPMRYESPLNPDEFRRESLVLDEDEDDSPSIRHEAHRISIRPTAGRPVGTVVSTTRVSLCCWRSLGCRSFSFVLTVSFSLRQIHEERAVTPKSRKQGLSHRKARRWNNDNFVRLANEIANSSRRGHIAAEVLLRGQEDAHLYRDVYDPKDHRSAGMSRYVFIYRVYCWTQSAYERSYDLVLTQFNSFSLEVYGRRNVKGCA
jgi:hypothetical protein